MYNWNMVYMKVSALSCCRRGCSHTSTASPALHTVPCGDLLDLINGARGGRRHSASQYCDGASFGGNAPGPVTNANGTTVESTRDLLCVSQLPSLLPLRADSWQIAGLSRFGTAVTPSSPPSRTRCSTTRATTPRSEMRLNWCGRALPFLPSTVFCCACALLLCLPLCAFAFCCAVHCLLLCHYLSAVPSTVFCCAFHCLSLCLCLTLRCEGHCLSAVPATAFRCALPCGPSQVVSGCSAGGLATYVNCDVSVQQRVLLSLQPR